MTVHARKLELRSGSMRDVAEVAAAIRASDLLDIEAVTSLPPRHALEQSFRSAHRRFAVDWEGRCVAVGGLEFESPTSARASLWLIGRQEFDQAARSGGARLSRALIFEVCRGASSVFNYVVADNHRTLRWLRWLGFEVVALHPDFRGLGRTCVEVELYLAGSSPGCSTPDTCS